MEVYRPDRRCEITGMPLDTSSMGFWSSPFKKAKRGGTKRTAKQKEKQKMQKASRRKNQKK